MSILVQTSYGDLTIDFFTDKCPTASQNFIKLCKLKYYNNALFINVQKDHLTQISTNKPTTIFKEVFQEEDYAYFEDQIDMEMKINKIGLLCTTNPGPNMNNSQFFITLSNNNLTSLYGKHTVFGEIQQGLDTLKKINAAVTDKTGRPMLNVRILHTHIIDDPFDDLEGMKEGAESPVLEKDPERLEVSEHMEILGANKTEEEMNRVTREQKAKKQAVTLEILGDLPDADAKPPENILFVCKLNPITQEKDLELIFSRYGNIKSCEIVRDWKTGQSLQYGFIEFEAPQSCQEAYLKMQKATIDNRKIEIDFCQSVQKLMPRAKRQEKKYGGQLRDMGKGELVPKFREGKDIYGEKSSKYDLVIKERRGEDRDREERYEAPSSRKFEALREQNQRDRSREKQRKQKSKKQHKKEKKMRRSPSQQSQQSRSRSRDKKKKHSKKHKKHSRSSSQPRHKHKK